MTTEDESRLVALALKGDEAAFEQLVRENQRLVYNTALKLTGNREDALDVSQEVFLRAYRSLSTFRGTSRLASWLYRLTYNASMDVIEKNRAKSAVSMTAEDGSDNDFGISDPDLTPEERLEKEETVRAVRAAVAALPEDKRNIIVMRDFSGLSYSEIAASLGIEEGTVKSRLARARYALAEILRENGTFPHKLRSNKRKGGDSDG